MGSVPGAGVARDVLRRPAKRTESVSLAAKIPPPWEVRSRERIGAGVPHGLQIRCGAQQRSRVGSIPMRSRPIEERGPVEAGEFRSGRREAIVPEVGRPRGAKEIRGAEEIRKGGIPPEAALRYCNGQAGPARKTSVTDSLFFPDAGHSSGSLQRTCQTRKIRDELLSLATNMPCACSAARIRA